MALDPQYITSVELQSYFVDKDTGLPLAGGQVWFWEDLNRNQLKPVYQLTGSPPNYTYTQLPNPLTLSGVGTFQDNTGNDIAVYYRPFDDFGNVQNYFIQVYAAGAPPPGGVPQFTREAWPNEISDNNTPGNIQSGYENELSNPQFAEVSFVEDDALLITYPGGAGIKTVSIAPDWDLEIVHLNAGSVTVFRNQLSGLSNIPTNPPFALTVIAGPNIVSLTLKQTLSQNPGIWTATNTANGYIASSITLGPNVGTVNMRYESSNGGPQQQLLIGNNIGGGVWKTINATVQLDPSTNPDLGGDGFVQIVIELPIAVNSTTTLTSIQVVGVDSPITNIGFDQEPVNRQIDHLFHYYNPQLRYKEIPSYLVGWDFPLNPGQFAIDDPTFTIGANKSQYVLDQTIVYQSVNTSVGVAKGTTGAIRLTSLATGSLALIQYLDQVQARKILNDKFAVNIAATTDNNLGTPAGVYFYYTKDVNLPNINPGTNNSLIATVDATGKPLTFNGNWFEVPRSNLGDATFTLGTSATTSFPDFNFRGWDMQAAADANLATYFAIVITFNATLNDAIEVQSVGLCAGDIATRPAPLTYDETLKQCEQYFETSYDTNVSAIGTAAIANALTAPQASSTNNANTYQYVRNNFGFTYRAKKVNVAPIVHLYSPSAGTIDRVDLTMRNADGSAIIAPNPTLVNTNNWLQTGLGAKGIFFSQTGAGTALGFNWVGGVGMPSVWINYHYVVDARLGIV